LQIFQTIFGFPLFGRNRLIFAEFVSKTNENFSLSDLTFVNYLRHHKALYIIFSPVRNQLFGLLTSNQKRIQNQSNNHSDMTIINQEVYLTVPESAKKMGVAPLTIRRWIQSKRLKVYKLSERKMLLKESDLNNLI